MKLWSSEHLFGHTWDQVTQALWRKYPNKLNPNVVAVDVIDRKVAKDGTLHTVRMLGTSWSMPSFVTALLGIPDMCFAVEYSIADPIAKTINLKSVNYTFGSVAEVKEMIQYYQNPEDENTTIMTHDAMIGVTGISFTDYCEGLIANGFDINANKGRQAIEQVIAKISFEGILETINEQMEELSRDLDIAKERINLEVGQITEKLNSEFQLFVQQLSYELDHLSIGLTSENKNIQSEHFIGTKSLAAAVKAAGLAES